MVIIAHGITSVVDTATGGVFIIRLAAGAGVTYRVYSRAVINVQGRTVLFGDFFDLRIHRFFDPTCGILRESS